MTLESLLIIMENEDTAIDRQTSDFHKRTWNRPPTTKITNIHELHVNAWQNRIIKQMVCEHLGNEVVIDPSCYVVQRKKN